MTDRHRPTDSPLTTEEVRTLLKQMSLVLSKIGDGVPTVDGAPLRLATTPFPHKMTIREMRASARDMPAPRARQARRKLQPRREYELKVAQTESIETKGLTPAALAIIRYLANKGRATIVSMVDEIQLRRSTIANALTELRKRQIVESHEVHA